MADNTQQDKLLEIIRTALARDNELREQHQIGEKFRFVRDRLQALLSHVEENTKILQATKKDSNYEMTSDEIVVYVHLFNAQGNIFKTWIKMLNPAVFYEYSVNRPIYTDKSEIEAFIRGKANKMQHAFLAFAIKKTAIKKDEVEIAKDIFGHELIKVQEGSLKLEKLMGFTHHEHDYKLNDDGELVRKE